MKNLLMLLLIVSVMTISISSCNTKTITKTRFVTSSNAADAIIDSLQIRLEACDDIRKRCCAIVEEGLINN